MESRLQGLLAQTRGRVALHLREPAGAPPQAQNTLGRPKGIGDQATSSKGKGEKRNRKSPLGVLPPVPRPFCS